MEGRRRGVRARPAVPLGVPVVVERSRSGNGAHVVVLLRGAGRGERRATGWAAISSPRRWLGGTSSAWTPTIGCFRARTPCRAAASATSLRCRSSTRPRQQGNTVFLDERLRTVLDDTVGVSRLTAAHRAERPWRRSPREATRTGQVVGVRFAEVADDEEAAAPWTRLPSGRPPATRITGPLPTRGEAASSRSGSSSRRPACPRRCSTRSSASPPSRTPSSTRSRACASRPR